jgi:hypothetical protein
MWGRWVRRETTKSPGAAGRAVMGWKREDLGRGAEDAGALD